MCVSVLVFSPGNFDIEQVWSVWIVCGNFLLLKTLNKHKNFYATGFVPLQSKEDLNIAPNCWKGAAGSVWCNTADTVARDP